MHIYKIKKKWKNVEEKGENPTYVPYADCTHSLAPIKYHASHPLYSFPSSLFLQLPASNFGQPLLLYVFPSARVFFILVHLWPTPDKSKSQPMFLHLLNRYYPKFLSIILIYDPFQPCMATHPPYNCHFRNSNLMHMLYTPV